MNEIKLINKIFTYEKLRNKLVLFFDSKKKPQVMTKDSFTKFCRDYSIDVAPSLLFDFFDSVGLKISIVPSSNKSGGFWSSRINTGEVIIISNDYLERKEATLGALIKSIEIYNDKLTKNEKD